MPDQKNALVVASDTAVTPAPAGERFLTRAEFQTLSQVPPETEWFANLENENTRKAYRGDIAAFMRFVGIEQPQEFRSVTRAHGIAWRKNLERQALAPASIWRSHFPEPLFMKPWCANGPLRQACPLTP